MKTVTLTKQEQIYVEKLNHLAELKAKPTLRIYTDGEYDRRASYKPVLRRKAAIMGTKLDCFFQTSKWPTDAQVDYWASED